MTTAGRLLTLVPIIHTQADLGSAADAVRKLQADAAAAKEAHKQAAWQQIAQKLTARPASRLKQTLLYQDGLPVCDRERDLVRELAEGGSANHQLLETLIERGATLVGSESAELLLEEYTLTKQILAQLTANPPQPLTDAQKQRSAELLVERDRFIASRIDATLGTDQEGILLLGAAHQIQPHLAKNITLRTLVL